MQILYKQADDLCEGPETALFALGFQQFFFKKLTLQQDSEIITKKNHHHKSYEIHILTEGWQTYTDSTGTYVIGPGQFLLIPPTVPHRVMASHPETGKYSLCFLLRPDSALDEALPKGTASFQGECTPEIMALLNKIQREYDHRKPFFEWSLTGYITALALGILRCYGLTEKPGSDILPQKNPRILLAKQYITDNVESVPSVPEVATYCHLSSRQLTRLFLQEENCTPAVFIRNCRLRKAESYLLETDLSLAQISEKMHFSTEYYFNTFFKTNAGMPPAEYRRMHAAK